MRAARFYDRGDIRIDEIDEPVVRAGQVAIDVAWNGICGTDLHEFLDGPIFCPSHEHPNVITGEFPPVTLGHEMSGIVNFVPNGVEGLKVGDHVVVEPYIVPAGEPTGEGSHYNLSEGSNFIGLGGNGGGLAEKIAVDARWVHKIPDSIPLDQAALIEPLSVAYHAYEVSEAVEGDTALIIGAGPIGLLTAAVLKAKGIKVIISEPSEMRRQKAKETGVAELLLNPMEDDIVSKVREFSSDGKGAAVGFECSSNQFGFNTLVDAVRPAGTIVVVAIWGKLAQVDFVKLTIKELKIKGTIAYCNTHPKTIELVASGKINLEPLITGKIGLDNLLDEGFDTLINHNETAVKILVSPTGIGL